MQKNNSNSKLNNKNQLNNLDFSVVGEIRGKDAYNMLVSMSSSGRILNHRKIFNQSIEKANIFSEAQKETMLKILDELKKYSNINPENE